MSSRPVAKFARVEVLAMPAQSAPAVPSAAQPTAVPPDTNHTDGRIEIALPGFPLQRLIDISQEAGEVPSMNSGDQVCSVVVVNGFVGHQSRRRQAETAAGQGIDAQPEEPKRRHKSLRPAGLEAGRNSADQWFERLR